SQPTANVAITVNGNSDVSASPTTLTFTPANWNTPQPVTVTAVNDTLVEGPESANITFASSSSDARFNGLKKKLAEALEVGQHVVDMNDLGVGCGIPNLWQAH